jgi:hypothetical protein
LQPPAIQFHENDEKRKQQIIVIGSVTTRDNTGDWKAFSIDECIAGLPHQFHIAMQHAGS